MRTTLITERANEARLSRHPQEQLAAAVRAEPAFQLDGHYNAEVAKSRLAQAGLTPEQYAQRPEERPGAPRAEDGMQLSQFVTPAELQRLHALTDQERQIRYAVLPLDKYAAAVPVTDAAIQAYYDAHKAQFMTPESVHLQYAQADARAGERADHRVRCRSAGLLHQEQEPLHLHRTAPCPPHPGGGERQGGRGRGPEEGPGHRGETEGGRQFRGAGQAVFR